MAREWQTPEDDAHNVGIITEKSLEFMETNRERPFFLFVSHNSIHTPLVEKEALISKYRRKPDADSPTNHRVIGAMIETLDQSVGRLLAKLDELELTERTLVLFYSDNGGLDWTATDGRIAANDPLRAGKADLYEGGIRVPLIVRWPGRIAPGRVSGEPVNSVDLFPTLLEAAGDAERGGGTDEMSLLPVLTGSAALGRNALFWHYPHYHKFGAFPSSAVRKGKYKLIEWHEAGIYGLENRYELYDLENDLGETRNLASSLPERTRDLAADLEHWRSSVEAQMPRRNPDYRPEGKDGRLAESSFMPGTGGESERGRFQSMPGRRGATTIHLVLVLGPAFSTGRPAEAFAAAIPIGRQKQLLWDGYRWKKPDLGRVEFKGSTRNNILDRRFREPLIPLGADGSFDSVLVSALQPIAHGERIFIYYRGRNWRAPGQLDRLGEARAQGAVGLAVLPLDGFISLDGAATDGDYSESGHTPLRLLQSTLLINAQAGIPSPGNVGEIRVEILRPDFFPVPGHSFEETDPVDAAGPESVASWQQAFSLARSREGELDQAQQHACLGAAGHIGDRVVGVLHPAFLSPHRSLAAGNTGNRPLCLPACSPFPEGSGPVSHCNSPAMSWT